MRITIDWVEMNTKWRDNLLEYCIEENLDNNNNDIEYRVDSTFLYNIIDIEIREEKDECGDFEH